MKGLDFAMRVRGVSRKVGDAHSHGAFLTFGAAVFGVSRKQDSGILRCSRLRPKPSLNCATPLLLLQRTACLEGQGDLVSRLITPITHIVTPIIPIINLVTKCH